MCKAENALEGLRQNVLLIHFYYFKAVSKFFSVPSFCAAACSYLKWKVMVILQYH